MIGRHSVSWTVWKVPRRLGRLSRWLVRWRLDRKECRHACVWFLLLSVGLAGVVAVYAVAEPPKAPPWIVSAAHSLSWFFAAYFGLGAFLARPHVSPEERLAGIRLELLDLAEEAKWIQGPLITGETLERRAGSMQAWLDKGLAVLGKLRGKRDYHWLARRMEDHRVPGEDAWIRERRDALLEIQGTLTVQDLLDEV